MVGFATDGVSVMVGKHNSGVNRFKLEIPTLMVFKCICHSLAFCASYACQLLPQETEEVIKSVYLYMKYSSKRQQSFQDIQISLELPDNHLLNTSQTRWLALRECVSRFIEQYDAIAEFLRREREYSQDAGNLYTKLKNPFFLLYLKFLDFIQPLVTDRNKEFQSEEPKVPLLHKKMESLYRSVLELHIYRRTTFRRWVRCL